MINRFAILLILPIFLYSCSKNSNKVDLSTIQLNVKIKRLDQDLFSFNADSILIKKKELKTQYGEFWDTYIEGIMSLGSQNGVAFKDNFKRLTADYSIQKAYQETQIVYPNVTNLEIEMTDILKHYKFYFPKDTIPNVYTCITGFNSSVLVDNKLIVIGLDKYLGSKSEIYPRLGLENYKISKMNPQNIATDVISSWSKLKFSYNDSLNNLMTQMIYEGRIIYFMHQMAPNLADSLKWGFNTTQMKWANKWEKKIWTYLVENKLLFTQNPNEIRRYIADGPFTNTFGNFSSPRAAVFTGYKIVESFMQNNKCTLADLMKIRDYQSILVQSKYRP